MAANTFVEIDLPEATDLADLTGIQVDLASTRNFARMLKKVFESEKPDLDLVEPLSTAILVRYIGVHRRLTLVLVSLGVSAVQFFFNAFRFHASHARPNP